VTVVAPHLPRQPRHPATPNHRLLGNFKFSAHDFSFRAHRFRAILRGTCALRGVDYRVTR
jgi:hypothetical protein